MSNPPYPNATTESAHDTAQDDSWQLMALSPELGDLSIPVGTSLRIGRQDSNDVVLASPRISRQHAKLNRIGDKLYVQDLGSANGTFVNGERITSEAVCLQTGDELAFGELSFVVVQGADIDVDALLDTIVNELSTPSVADKPLDAADAPSPMSISAPVVSYGQTDLVTTRDTPATSPDDTIVTTADNTQTNTTVYTITDNTHSDNTQATTTTTATHHEVPETLTTQTPVQPSQNPSTTVTHLQPPVTPVASATQAVTPPVTTNSAPIAKAETKKMANIAIIIVVLIALAIIASLFL